MEWARNSHQVRKNGKTIFTSIVLNRFWTFRLIKRLCEENDVPKLVNKTCKGFKIYPPNRFYSIPWWNWRYFFQEEFLDLVKEQTADSYIIHVWNKFSINTNISLHNENVPYLNFAKLYCPAVVAQCDRYF